MALDFGVEIETLVPGQASFRNRVAEGIARDISEAGVPCGFEGYNHTRRDHWKIVTDASLTAPNGYLGFEFVSPPLSDAGFPQIDAVCRMLQRSNARVNRTCGLHVHIGARRLTLDAMRRLAFLYIENEDVIDALMPPSRRKDLNNFCRGLQANADIEGATRATDVRALAKAIRRNDYGEISRHTKLNFAAYWRHGTVEFRQHSGTIDAEKIKRWVGFCQKLVDVAALDQPVTPPAQNGPNPALQRIMQAERLRRIYEAMARPEGATGAEVQAILGPGRTDVGRRGLATECKRMGIAYETIGRRDGHLVYKVAVSSPQTPPTLASLLEKLSFEESDAEFWRNRASLLASAEGVAADYASSGGD
jgi:Putative amidoligase enzyme